MNVLPLCARVIWNETMTERLTPRRGSARQTRPPVAWKSARSDEMVTRGLSGLPGLVAMAMHRTLQRATSRSINGVDVRRTDLEPSIAGQMNVADPNRSKPSANRTGHDGGRQECCGLTMKLGSARTARRRAERVSPRGGSVAVGGLCAFHQMDGLSCGRG